MYRRYCYILDLTSPEPKARASDLALDKLDLHAGRHNGSAIASDVLHSPEQGVFILLAGPLPVFATPDRQAGFGRDHRGDEFVRL